MSELIKIKIKILKKTSFLGLGLEFDIKKIRYKLAFNVYIYLSRVRVGT